MYTKLKPGGLFLYTDFMRPDVRIQREKDIREAGLDIVKMEDTSINTLHSLKLDEKRK